MMVILPNKLLKYRNPSPKDRHTDSYLSSKKELLEAGYSYDDINSFIMTVEGAHNALNELGINRNSAFYDYYTDGYEEPENNENDLLYGLEQIIEYSKNSFWEEYPQIGKRYLQMSSIEGEWSYFYDKETDAMYGVDWNEMDDLIAGKLKPLFTSFYDFLEWYYSAM